MKKTNAVQTIIHTLFAVKSAVASINVIYSVFMISLMLSLLVHPYGLELLLL